MMYATASKINGVTEIQFVLCSKKYSADDI